MGTIKDSARRSPRHHHLPRIQASPYLFFFFNDTPTTEIYTLSLHDALPISSRACSPARLPSRKGRPSSTPSTRSEEHTSELQSQSKIVCRLLLEKKKKKDRCSVADVTDPRGVRVVGSVTHG